MSVRKPHAERRAADAADPASTSFAARPRLIIDLDALAANWRAIAAQAPGAETGAVVKADGYGLGAAAAAKRLAAEGCGTFFVALPDEGRAVREALGPGPRILILDGPTPDDVTAIRAHGLEPVLNTPWQIALWAAQGDGAPCTLHVDTGINRLGLAHDALDAVRSEAAALTITMVMSHLACAAEPERPENARQLDRYRAALQALAPIAPEAATSLSASAGALLGPDYHFDLIRPGIALYGGAPTPGHAFAPAPVAALEARILQVRDLEAGAAIGYGGDHVCAAPTRVATVAAGYADGVLRSLAGRGYARIAGERAAVIGRISMDLITLDAGAAGPRATPGASATFFDQPGDLDAAADAAGTIAYEMLTALGARAERVYRGGAS